MDTIWTLQDTFVAKKWEDIAKVTRHEQDENYSDNRNDLRHLKRLTDRLFAIIYV